MSDLAVEGLIGRRYRVEILKLFAFPYAAVIGDNFILMDENCRPHCSNLVDDFPFEKVIVRMEWPAYSLDTNPIEYVRDKLERRIVGFQNYLC